MEKKILIFVIHVIINSIKFSRTNSFSLPMIPIDSPQLQLFPQGLTTHERHQMLANMSLSRALSRVRVTNPTENINSIKWGVERLLSNFYVTQIFFGTNSSLFSPFVLLDTGAYNTWVQCDGCNPCFEISTGNIRVHDSRTYRLLSLNDPRCVPKLVYQGSCGFSITYGGGAFSTGPMGTDTFRFINSTTLLTELHRDIAFGCGLQNVNFEFGYNTGPRNSISGILGLAAQPQSFLMQLAPQTQGRFSYCLTSWTEPNPGKSSMYFGDSAQITGPNIKRISMNTQSMYHLQFRGITVNGKRLTFPPLFCSRNTQGNGFYIDSGSPYTVLPINEYLILRAAMIEYFLQYGWLVDRYKLGQRIFDLCYATTPTRGQKYPSVVFHFWDGNKQEVVDWVMNDENMFMNVNDNSRHGFCMVVIPNHNPTTGACLFGAYQQANFKVLYDTRSSSLFFSPQRCHENHP